MSRRYEMQCTVSKVKSSDVEKINDVMLDLWDGWEPSSKVKVGSHYNLWYGGEGFLCGGTGEEEFAREVAETIWEAVGDYREVEVISTYLEELPNEVYRFDKDEYDEYKENL
jgi:hypothetical protein